jgi:long-chain acyl-CoA synthetase
VVAENEEQVDKLYAIRDNLGKVTQVIYDDPWGLDGRDDAWLANFASVQVQGDEFAQSHPDHFQTEIDKGSAEDTAILCYTSGTTGNPKGVMLSYANLNTAVQEAQKYEDWRAGDNVIAYLPMAWVGDFVWSVAGGVGLRMVVNCPESRETLRRDYREIGPAIVVAPPAVWEDMVTRIQVRMDEADWLKKGLYGTFMATAVAVERAKQHGQSVSGGRAIKNWLGDLLVRRPLRDLLGVSNIRKAYTGGAPLGPDTFDFIRALGVNLKQGYGMTESSAFSVFQPDGEANSETVGKPVPSTAIKLSDTGEVLMRGPQVFQGYYKNEEATKDTVDAEGWLATGDAGITADNGHIKIIDRAKDVGKLNDGTLFAPQHLENKLKFSPYIKEAVAIGQDMDYVTTMINIEMDSMELWAERNNISYTGYQDLSQRDEVYDLIIDEVRKVNEDLARDSALAGTRIRRALILSKELDADDGEITRTRKLRRGVINDRYGALIEGLYSGADSVDIEISVTYEDGSVGKIQSNIKIVDVENAGAGSRAAA